MLLGSQSVDLNQKSRGGPHDSGKAAGVVAQQLALPVDEVDASASVAGDSLVIVLGRIFIVVRPVLDLHPSAAIEAISDLSARRFHAKWKPLYDSELPAGESNPEG
jgi:hypothetical protein